MPPKKSSNLGRSLIKSRFGNKGPVNADGTRHVADLEDGSKYDKIMDSITQESDLESFLNTAQLAGTAFVAEKRNVSVVEMSLGPAGKPTGQQVQSSSEYFVNPHLLTPEQMQEALSQQAKHKDSLSIPRRPEWNSKTTREQLQRAEKDSFLGWRRNMARLEEEQGLLLTPYERNIEIWRQLWRVIERSHLIVQIVDARNPLLFYSTDLEKYVQEVANSSHGDEIGKRSLLLVNKADFLTLEQRKKWAETFDAMGVKFVFFSAALAAVEQQDDEEVEQSSSSESEPSEEEGVRPISLRRMQKLELERSKRQEKVELEEEYSDSDEDLPLTVQQSGTRNTMYVHRHAQREEVKNSTRILSVPELLALFDKQLKEMSPDGDALVIGMVGYPNVGKSSTINALLRSKRVSVSATPGKTKHFQTLPLQLSDTQTVTLCDCPGLVFPTFATTKADLVTQGILPVDQLREHLGPVGLLCQRVPKSVLEWTYGIRIKLEGEKEREFCRPEELLQSYALARGYTRSSQGNPDESRAARYILKDYINGRILHCIPPKGVDAMEFNRELYEGKTLSAKRELKMKEKMKEPPKPKTTFDNSFFRPVDDASQKAFTVGKFASSGYQRTQLYPSQTNMNNDGSKSTVTGYSFTGSLISSRTSKADDPLGKKHYKNDKRSKNRQHWTAQD